jgi:hypothetical protein
MLDMCVVNHVFLQANSCPISEMKSIRHKCVSQRRKEEETVVCNIGCLLLWSYIVFETPHSGLQNNVANILLEGATTLEVE